MKEQMNEKNEEHEQYELDKIRIKKMKALLDAQKMQQVNQERAGNINEKVDFILRAVLHPSAYSHLDKIKKEEPAVYQRIYNELISPDVFESLDYLVAVIQQQRGVPRQIPLDAIIYLERKIKGIKSSIKVKQGDGEVMDLGSYLTK